MAKTPTWKLSPPSAMMTYGYDPMLSEGAVVCPEFHTSTFAFRNAETGENCFSHPEKASTLIYSRLNHPNAQIFEERLALWEEAEACVAFNSGMSCIFTVCFEYLQPGDILLYSEPLYGGTDTLFKQILPAKMEITGIGFKPEQFEEKLRFAIDTYPNKKIGMVFIETPANPTNQLVDIPACVNLIKQYCIGSKKPIVAVDNTFLGPLFQHPLACGADISVYSATKFIGGHSDVIAGAAVGSEILMNRLRKARIYLGTTLSPDPASRLLRSLQTLEIRMKRQMETATRIATYLQQHPKIEKVYALSLLTEVDSDYQIYQKQCLGTGSIISFDIQGGKAAAFRFLDALTLFKLAVSLGSTESLAQHPYTMTHAGVSLEAKADIGINESMIRLSIGVETADDLITDLEQALAST